MKWQIPAKTFLVGEYAALIDAPAILLTTEPNFELTIKESVSSLIHSNSPAGRFWCEQGRSLNQLDWVDPYHGRGGLGASSAQFIGAYLADCYLKDELPKGENLLKAYYQYAWHGQGVKPSGYDVIAQSQHGCVYIDNSNKTISCFDWIFKDIAFILLHTGNKLATHAHLESAALLPGFENLKPIVKQAGNAFKEGDSEKLINAIDAYQRALTELNLVAPTTLELLKQFKTNNNFLAAKGCGALGMDILLLIVSSHKLKNIVDNLRKEKWLVLATSQDLFQGKKLLELHQIKTSNNYYPA
ncbi:mevalonate kinase [Legionella busanensis]|uniref:Mevalonate kinase n=1 Tax=Legionella busanensis TaxID=190655 RepID=A0A378JQF7_9GAMM|nr:hypothetical protein [Legionella busanensis]STX52493.1 mevalonate kinase [Legionella busanensis]